MVAPPEWGYPAVMYNLLISLLITALAYALGAVVASTWIAGLPPAVLALGISYVLLARRTGRQLQEVVERVTELLKKQRLTDAVRMLEAARPLGRWQFLVTSQLESQLGALAYMQRDFKTARPHLEKAYSRDWAALCMRAALAFREKDLEQARKLMDKAKGPGKKQAIYWGLYTYILVENGLKDEALTLLAEALKVLPDSEPLKTARNSVSNNKKLRMKLFGQQWYTFFPEKFPVRRYAQAPQGKTYPMPRR